MYIFEIPGARPAASRRRRTAADRARLKELPGKAMINLIFIIPYEELRALVEQALLDYQTDEKITSSCYVLKTWELEDKSFSCDVVISRGYTVQVLKEKYPDLVCVPLKTSGYDIIHAVHSAERRFTPKKIALIGSPFMVYDAEYFDGIFDTEIITYAAETMERIPEAYGRAKKEGCDCFIGGLTLVDYCGGNENAVMVENGKFSILQALDEAVRLTKQTREERSRTALLRTIIGHAKEGVMYLDEAGSIAAANEKAEQYLGSGKKTAGKNCSELWPFFTPCLETVKKERAPLENEIFTINDKLLTIDFIPALNKNSVAGFILFIQSVSRIQREESQIRKKIHGKGLKAKYTFDDILCRGGAFKKTISQAKQFAATGSPILITGESGTGKELLAQSIHNAGERRNGPFVAINCAALSENLLESELFGYSEGAFTGALKGGKPGLFEMAHGGGIFLDEISEIPVSFQTKLLRVLQENEIRRVGDDKVLSIDIRVITATNRNLRDLVRRGLFRQDLLFRLDVLKLKVPPLRERPEDIIALFERYVSESAKKYRKEIPVPSEGAKRLLINHIWEGNVRELRNTAERIAVLSDKDIIEESDIREALYDNEWESAAPSASEAGRDIPEEKMPEKDMLLLLCERFGGRKGKIAEYLGIDRTTLWRKLKRYRI